MPVWSETTQSIIARARDDHGPALSAYCRGLCSRACVPYFQSDDLLSEVWITAGNRIEKRGEPREPVDVYRYCITVAGNRIRREAKLHITRREKLTLNPTNVVRGPSMPADFVEPREDRIQVMFDQVGPVVARCNTCQAICFVLRAVNGSSYESIGAFFEALTADLPADDAAVADRINEIAHERLDALRSSTLTVLAHIVVRRPQIERVIEHRREKGPDCWSASQHQLLRLWKAKVLLKIRTTLDPGDGTTT